jgi:hypothetical protein
MRMSTACFARAPQRYTSRLSKHLLLTFQGVTPLSKTRNQLCDTRFDDLTDTIFAGHHQPLKVWVLCLYFMGLNVSNEQIAHELALNVSDANLDTVSCYSR